MSDACGDVVDTSDVEEREDLEAQQPGYYERVWGKIQKIPGSDDEVAFERPLNRTPSTTPLLSEHDLPENDSEDIIPYSQDIFQHPATVETPQTFTPEPIPSDEPIASQDPLCLFSFPSSSFNAISRSRTPLTPLKTTSPFKIPESRLHSQNRDTEFLMGSATKISNTLQPVTPLKSCSPGPVRLSSLSPLSLLSASPAKELAETSTNPTGSPSHRHSESCLSPPISSSPRFPQQSHQSSPAPSPHTYAYSHREQNSPPNVDENTPFITLPDSDHPTRKYSLRNRSAKQLNPFEYDSRQYKRLLRHMPEAIVRKTLLRNAHGHEEQDNDWVESQAVGQEESQELEMLRSERRHRLEQRSEIDRLLKELHLTLSSSDEASDLENERERAIDAGDAHIAQQPRGKKRKRTVRPFPLRILETNNQPDPQESPNISPIRYSSHQSPNRSPLFPAIDDDFHQPYDDLRPPSLSIPDILQYRDPLSKGISPTPSSDHNSSDRELSSRRRKRLRRGPRSNSESDVMVLEEPRPATPNSIHGSDSESSSRSRNGPTAEEKILRRFLPAGVVKKFLEQDKPVKSGSKNRNDVNRQADNDVVRPGHGRKRIVSPNSRDPLRYQIKGDTESESDSSSRSSSKEVIEISDDALSEGEEDIELLEKDSEGILEENELQSWLIGDPTIHESDAIVESTRRRSSDRELARIEREPELIDRMLQRTRRVGISGLHECNKRNGRLTGVTSSDRVETPNVYRTRPKRLYQTRLTFDRIGKVSKKAKPPREHRSPSFRIHSHDSEAEVQQVIVPQGAAPEKAPRKKRYKRARPDKYQNVYFTRNNGVNITSGRSRPFIQINVHDEDFHAALAPETSLRRPQVPKPHHNRRKSDLIHKFRNAVDAEREEFDTDGHGPSIQKISLDLGIHPIPAGLTLSREGYIGRGRLFELITFLNGPALPFECPSLFATPDICLDPRKTVAEMSIDLTSVFDKLYNASTTLLGAEAIENNIADMQSMSYALRQLATYKVLHADEAEANHITAFISEQAKHLLARIDERLELVSADGHSLDFRSFGLYWLAVELHLRIAYAGQRRSLVDGPSHILNTHAAEEYAIQLVRRLLEYGLDRIMDPLQKDGLMVDKTSPDMRVLEYWVCIIHVSAFLFHSVPSSGPSFWRLIESGLELQSNKPDSPVAQSERIWKTVFMINAFSQFSMEGISRTLVKADPYWGIIIKVLQSIRLNADPQRDNAKPAAVLQKRDAYLRLVTARCYLLSSRWYWDTNDAEEVFRELYSIFRSREFGNLLGEPDDFPSFIRDRDEALCHSYSIADTAYSAFMKLVIRAVRNFNGDERLRATKITRLLSLIVPVGATSFSKTSPPLHNDLSKLYNRYTAVYVAIYVDPSEKQIRSRLQQVRRYVNFKTADSDSRMAAIRAMMNISILLRHLRKPLDDILQWASEMIGDLLSEYGELQARTSMDSDVSRIILLIQTVLGTIRFIMTTPTLDRTAPTRDQYPDIAYLQVWMPQVLSSPLVKDHRTGLEICSCIQEFLSVRAKVIPLAAIPKPRLEESQESQEDYGDYDLDMNDPTLLALFDQSEPVNENHAADLQASEVLNAFSSKMYSCVCMHLGCPYKEIDTWLESWLGFGKILVQNRKKEWDYYLKLGESAWQDIKDPFRRMYIRLRFMMTVLRLDPSSYKTHAIEFLKLGLEALVSPKTTLEHEYYSLLLCVDGLFHPLLRQMPCTVDPNTGLFNLDKSSFLDKRTEFIAKIFHNASLQLSISPATVVLDLVEVLLTALSRWKEGILQENQNLTREYEKLSEDTLALARSHDIFRDHLRPHLPNFFS